MKAHRVLLLTFLSASLILLEGCKKEEEIDPVTHTINLSVLPEGLGEITGAGVYEVGELVEIRAQAPDVWEFMNWTDEDFVEVSTQSVYTFEMPDNDVTLIASFAIKIHIVPGSFTDNRDGNTYKTVLIGEHEWMAENLRYLPEINTNEEFSDAVNNSEPAYGVYGYNGSVVEEAMAHEHYNNYGVLYNWWAGILASDEKGPQTDLNQGVCPAGWYMPGNEDWEKLLDYVEAQGYPNESDNPYGAGNALKSCRQAESWLGGDCATPEHPRWEADPDHFGMDVFGFAALPGGLRHFSGNYHTLGFTGKWWSADDSDVIGFTSFFSSSWMHGNAGLAYEDKGVGLSVRCVRDAQ
jgi:uncharacterized protein (TIGR02145 family)